MREQLAALEASARARLDPASFDYFAGGSGDERSLVEAERSWDRWDLCPRVLRDVSEVDTTCDILGERLSFPVLAAPVGFHVLAHDEGELATAHGVREAGCLLVVSTRATKPIEEIAAAAGRPWWFQVYVLKDRGLTRALVERAVAAGASALVLTGDTPIVGPKARASGPVPLTDEQYLANLRIHLAAAYPGREATAQDPSITEAAISWLAGMSGLPVLVKGVLRRDDARRCIESGAAGVVVSNHGGRQLDGARSTASALPGIVDEAGPDVPVLVDGGIRDGRSVLKAICLGARAVMLGRPVIWALAAGGAGGVRELLEGMRLELVESMMLAGARTLAECDRSLVEPSGAAPLEGAPPVNVTVLGAGSWGTTLASLVAPRHPTILWARDEDVARQVTEERENGRYLAGYRLPAELRATDDLEEAVAGADVAVVAVPTGGFRAVLEAAKAAVRPWIPVVSLAKGFEHGTCLRMTEVIRDVLPGHPAAALTGPNIAREIMEGKAAAAVVATQDLEVATELQQMLTRGVFRVYVNHDVAGCEIGGALKNVVAIAAGIGQGLGVGDNTRAAVMARGLAELTRLGVAMGAEPATFAGLAGMGDLIVTCISPYSRNRLVGERLGRGDRLEDILAEMQMVAEGVRTAELVLDLADRHGLDLPICRAIHQVVAGTIPPEHAYFGLRAAGHEADPG